MSKKLPFVTSDIPRDLRSFLDRLRELVSGSGPNRLLTANDLADSGIASVDGAGNISPPSAFVAAPPAPTNVRATAALRNIIITWDNPAYGGHAYAEVWGSSTSLQSEAVLLGMSPGAIYVDEVGPSITRYYWVRFVNTSSTPGPYNALAGTSATTGSDVSYTLEILSGQITTTELSASLNSRINLIDGPDTTAGSVSARVKTEADARVIAVSAETDARAIADGVLTTAVATEQLLRSSSDGALASQNATLRADSADNAAAITAEQIARTTADSAVSEQTSALLARTADNTALVFAEQTARTTADSAVSAQTSALLARTADNTALVFTEQTARTTADSANASQTQVLAATTGTNAAAITAEQTARTTADSATASQTQGIAAATGTNAAAITAEQTARTTADSANASQTQVLAAATGANNAAILSEQTARTTADSAVSAQTSSLLARTADNAALVFAEQTARTTADVATASRISGLSASTADNAALVFAEQTARTTADVATASQISGLSASTGDAFSAVQSEATTRLGGYTTLATSINALSSQVNDPVTGLPATRADLSTNYLTSADTENAIAQSATFLRAYADIQSKVFRTADAPTKRGVDPETEVDVPLETGDVWYDTNDSNKLYLWSGTVWVYSPDGVITGSVANVDARVTTVETTKIGYCTIDGVASDHTTKASCEDADGTWNVGIPLASAVKQVNISDGAASATLEQRFTAQKTLNDGLQLQYTIKLDANGYVSGYGVYSDATGSSEFIANVNRFAVTTPQTSIALRTTSTAYAVGAIVRVADQDSKTLVCKIGGSTSSDSIVVGNIGTLIVDGSVTWQVASRVPFAVQAVPTNINGQPVPAGVYIDAAYVLNATIQNSQIANLAVDDTKIASVSAGKLTAGSIDVDTYVQSSNFVAGSQGWKIYGNGDTEFSNGVFRGAVYASSGTFSGALSAATGTFSGSLQAATGTFSGALSAATGTFSGELVAATGTFSGSLAAANGTFSGTLLAGTLDLSSLVGQSTSYNSPGTYTITCPASFNKMRVTLVGGGGGGGGGSATYNEGRNSGGGGGGGGVVIAEYVVSAGQSWTLVVGGGGAGAPSTEGQALNRTVAPAGSSGSNTYISGLVTAYGGSGGGGANYGTGGAGGAGGAGTTNGYAGGVGTFVYFPGDKDTPAYYAGGGGAGGNAALNYGAGGAGGTYAYRNWTILNGHPGGLYGGGGGGGCYGTNQGGCGGGGSGNSGRAVIEFFNANGVIVRAEWSALISQLQTQLGFIYTAP